MNSNDLTIAEVIDSFQAVNDFLADHPDLPAAHVGQYGGRHVSLWLHRSRFGSDDECRTEYARCARILMAGAPIGSIKKEASDFSQSVTRQFGVVSLDLHVTREAVCEKRVIGVEVVEVPDPTARKVKIERDVIEWVCSPILPAEVSA